MIPGRPLRPEDVVWSYLVQEHHHKGILGPILGLLAVTSSAVPSAAQLLHGAASAPKAFWDYGDAVRQTVEKYAKLSWTECTCHSSDVGAFLCQLPGAGPQSMSAIAPLWPSVRTTDEAKDHAVLLGKLQAKKHIEPTIAYDSPAGITVGDGKHRLFAFLEYALTVTSATTRVYVGR